MKIKDLVEVKDVRTVVQMADIQDPKLREFLTESFVITDEVEKVMLSFFNDLINKQGKGYFLEGNFGSGKSHLLSVLSLLIDYEKSWQHILSQTDRSERLNDFYQEVKDKNYITINLSLVEHSNKEYLEDIVIDEITKFINQDENLSDFNLQGEKEFIDKISNILLDFNERVTKPIENSEEEIGKISFPTLLRLELLMFLLEERDDDDFKNKIDKVLSNFEKK